MLRLIAPLVSGFASGSIKTTVRRTRNQAICYAIVGFAFLMALIFLCVVAFIALSWVIAPIWAATVVFAFWVVVALLAFLIGQYIAVKKQKNYEKQMQDERSSLFAATAIAAIPAVLKNKKLLALAVPLIGLAAFMYSNKDNEQ